MPYVPPKEMHHQSTIAHACLYYCTVLGVATTCSTVHLAWLRPKLSLSHNQDDKKYKSKQQNTQIITVANTRVNNILYSTQHDDDVVSHPFLDSGQFVLGNKPTGTTSRGQTTE
jgi:hypothetical protein